ncbi:MAG: ABC transporter ATP-binding protein [Elusimicrobiota bacterium]
MLEIKRLTKTYKNVYACKDINFRVQDGEFFVLLGPSGCGKTTTLRLIAGLEDPDKGDILLNNKSITEMSPQDRNTAMVFQNYALYPNMTVRKNLEFPLKMRKTDKKEIPDIIESTSKLLQIYKFLDKKAVKLSGGQQQRVAVGRALVRKPEIFLLDEPLSNLDAKLRQRLRIELVRIHNELNITTIYVTHDQSEAMTLGDRIAVMREGRIQQIGRPQQIYSQPVDLFAAKFIGFPEINIFDGVIKKDIVEILGKEIKLPEESKYSNKKVKAGIRPEDINVVDEKNGYKTSLEIKEVSGPDTILYLKYKNISIRVRASKEKSKVISKNEKELFIEFAPDKLLFFNPEDGKRIKL